MTKHIVGFGITTIGTMVLGPIGLIAGLIVWYLACHKS